MPNPDISAKAVKAMPLYNFIKRVADIVLSAVGIVLLLPVFLVILIVIRLDSKGGAFFVHKRVGYKGKPLKMYKFRTMFSNAKSMFDDFTPEQKQEFQEKYKLDKDPRVTKAGALLRKTSLDELPQLLNILKGDLSVVGPRPVVSAELEKYGIYAEKFQSVKPGLTG